MSERVTIVCSRDGFGLAATATGSLRHGGGRWTGQSCGQAPDPIPFIVWLARFRGMPEMADAELAAWRERTGRYAGTYDDPPIPETG